MLPHGVNADRFVPPPGARPTAPWDARPHGLGLLYIGPLIRRKGLHTLMEALAIVRRDSIPFRLSLVGRGPEEENLRILAGRLGISERVDFVFTPPPKR